jgi:hypothetical protein
MLARPLLPALVHKVMDAHGYAPGCHARYGSLPRITACLDACLDAVQIAHKQDSRAGIAYSLYPDLRVGEPAVNVFF